LDVIPQFLIDNNLPPAICDWLSERGLAAVHVREVGLANSSDTQVWDYAGAHDLAIVTKDRDFDRFAEQDLEAHVIVFRLTLGNATTAALWSWLETRIEFFKTYEHDKKSDVTRNSVVIVLT
jgi:predicted nuclease of predicted toxin-antitoxin system